MSNDPVFVALDIGKNNQIFQGIVAQLIYENGRPFALLPPGRVASLPEKVALYTNRLQKLRDASAGSPEWWDHPLVAIL